ncbi:hypothetical protein MHBO_002712 [Bonamia ostreae]|uniref:Uncharacterized protein n=1 Tax=Bonamia ostreae TaxID=126728 RepID=A0ABV2AN75_9EUKA
MVTVVLAGDQNRKKGKRFLSKNNTKQFFTKNGLRNKPIKKINQSKKFSFTTISSQTHKKIGTSKNFKYGNGKKNVRTNKTFKKTTKIPFLKNKNFDKSFSKSYKFKF